MEVDEWCTTVYHVSVTQIKVKVKVTRRWKFEILRFSKSVSSSKSKSIRGYYCDIDCYVYCCSKSVNKCIMIPVEVVKRARTWHCHLSCRYTDVLRSSSSTASTGYRSIRRQPSIVLWQVPTFFEIIYGATTLDMIILLTEFYDHSCWLPIYLWYFLSLSALFVESCEKTMDRYSLKLS